jgi:hypothetical protein
MKFIIYIAFTTVIILTGCLNTEGVLEIKGTVSDEATKRQIPYRKIIIQALVESNKVSEESKNQLVTVDAGQFTTDSSGFFTYSLQKVKDARRYNFCLVGDSDYAFINKEITLFELKRNALYLSFDLSKLVDFTIKIFRWTKTPAGDTLFLSWESDGVDGRALYPYKIDNYKLKTDRDLELTWIGGNGESTIKTRAFADKKTKVRWVLFRNGKMKEIVDTITCKRGFGNSIKFIY